MTKIPLKYKSTQIITKQTQSKFKGLEKLVRLRMQNDDLPYTNMHSLALNTSIVTIIYIFQKYVYYIKGLSWNKIFF